MNKILRKYLNDMCKGVILFFGILFFIIGVSECVKGDWDNGLLHILLALCNTVILAQDYVIMRLFARLKEAEEIISLAEKAANGIKRFFDNALFTKEDKKNGNEKPLRSNKRSRSAKKKVNRRKSRASR